MGQEYNMEGMAYLEFLNLGIEDLVKIKIPERYFSKFLVGFTCKKEEYNICYNFREGEQRISLLGFNTCEKEFQSIEKIVAKLIGGEPQNQIKIYENSLSDYISLNHGITQSNAADFVKKLNRHFNNVTIHQVVFIDVPESFYKNSGLLPNDSIIINKTAKNHIFN